MMPTGKNWSVRGKKKMDPIYRGMGHQRRLEAEQLGKTTRKKPRLQFGLPRRKSTMPEEIALPSGCFERGRIQTKDVLILPQHKDIDQDVVHRIQESFKLTGGGCFQPIGIRRIVETAGDEDVVKNVLVFGAKRLQAQKDAGLKHIDCVYLSGSETDIKLIELSENFLRTEYTVLDRAEQMVNWYGLAAKKQAISGQLDRKSKRLGRPPGGMAKAARWLSSFGQTSDARRKALSRATKIAGICATAKEIARALGLDNNQRALLRIADAPGPVAQAERAQALADSIRGVVSPPLKDVEKSAKDAKGSGAKQVGSDHNLEDDDDSAENCSEREDAPDETESGENGEETLASAKPKENSTLEELETFWGSDGKELWQYTPKDVREQFIERRRRALCRASLDMDQFIKNVFWGRSRIGCEDLAIFAKAKGLSSKAVASRVKQLGYKRKRNGWGNGPHFYYNIDRDYDVFKVVSDAEIGAAVSAKRDVESKRVEEMEPGPKKDYYDVDTANPKPDPLADWDD